MIEFSERSTTIILTALYKLKNISTEEKIDVKEIEELICRIEKNNEDRHIRNIWRAMLDRCRNPHNKYYEKYGGRGISVCEDWHHLKNFKEWCYNNGYQFKLTIDRINNDCDYSPENCRITSQKEQQRNRRNNRLLIDPFDNERMCLAAMAEKHGIKIQTLANRINRDGLSLEEALTKPVKKRTVKPKGCGTN